MDVRSHPARPDADAEGHQRQADPTPVPGDEHRDTGGERGVVRREAVVGGVGEQRVDVRVHDERARVGVERPRHLHEEGDHDHRHDRLDGEHDLLATGAEQPHGQRAGGDDVEAALGDGDDNGGHAAIVRAQPAVRLTGVVQRPDPSDHSHSIVPGGLLVMSRTTRLTCGTSLVIRVEMVSSTS
jgi:hypothetical protein